MRPDYWLGTDTIASNMGGDAHLTFGKKGLGYAKQDGPEYTGYLHTSNPHSQEADEPILIAWIANYGPHSLWVRNSCALSQFVGLC